MLVGRPKSGGDQQRAEFVAVQTGGVRLVVQTGPADMSGRGMAEEFFLDGVAVEPRDGAEPACDSGPGSAAGFEVAGEALDVRAAGLEQAQQVNWRRSSSYASRVRPLYPAKNPANASRSVLVNTGAVE